MAGRRRKIPRKRNKGRPATAARGPAVDAVGTARPAPGGLTTPLRGLGTTPGAKGRKGSFATMPDANAGRFLSPEQQFLLKKRREAELRAAKDRRAAVGIVLAVVLVLGGGVAALVWLWQGGTLPWTPR